MPLFYNDAPFLLRKLLHQYPECYAIFELYNNIEEFCFPVSLMVEKQQLIKINGVDEKIEDSRLLLLNLIHRLDKMGLRKIISKEVKYTLNRNMMNEGEYNFKEIFYPNQTKIVKKKKQMRVCEKVIFDWKYNPYSKELCQSFLNSFETYWIKEDAFNKKYEKIILCQSYNEIELIDDFLMDVGQYFDGIILLDDGSNDGTYEKAMHDKLLLKFKKKHTVFNDLGNRNTLLDIASFSKADWFCFMDIDEKFDSRYVRFFHELHKIKANSIVFLFVHLWNTPEEYNFKMRDCVYDGIFLRWRMFRNIGRTNIVTTQKKLHFAASPLMYPFYIAPVLVHHYGTLTKQRRLNKFNFYKKEDSYHDQKSYDDLLHRGETYSVKTITESKIQKCRQRFYNKINTTNNY